MLKDKVNEYNFKTPFHKAKAAIYISGKRKGKSEKAIMQDMKDYFAKQAAINDINKDRSVRTMSKREQMFNSPIKDETFDIDFRELDDYDSYYDDFSRNNKQVDADDYDRYYSARFGYGNNSYVDERIRYKMNRNDKSLLERLTKKYGKKNLLKEMSIESFNTYGTKGVNTTNNKLNEDFSFVKDKMTYEEIVKAFFKLRLREPLAEITSKKYPEVEELINYLPNKIATETWGLQKVNKSYGIKLIIGYNGKIYLHYVRIDDKYDKEYWTKIDIRTLPEKYANNCLNCLIRILHRLKKENEDGGEEIMNNNETIKQLNSNANKIYTDTDYYYKDGEFYIKSCSFEEFIKRHPLTVINQRLGRYNGKDCYDYELGGDFNDNQHRKSGKRQPELELYGRYYIDENRFELIYNNPWEGTYTNRKVNYIPIDAFVRKPSMS